MENLRQGSARWAGTGAERPQVRRNCFKNAWFDREEVKLTLSAYLDQATGLKLLNVMGKCGR